MILFSIIFAYLGLFAGLYVAGISPEELKRGRQFFYPAKKFMILLFLFVLVFSILIKYNFWLALILSSVISLFSLKIRFSNQIVYLFAPVIATAVVAFGNTWVALILLCLLFLFGLFLGSDLVGDYVGKTGRKLSKTRFEISKVALRKTSLFFVSFAASAIVVTITAFA